MKKQKEKENIYLVKNIKKNISESKKGKKATEETKLKFSEQRRGRKNSNYSNDIIKMYDFEYNFLMEFKDCIEACEYVRNNINQKVRTSDIFAACKNGKTRYGYKWKRFKK